MTSKSSTGGNAYRESVNTNGEGQEPAYYQPFLTTQFPLRHMYGGRWELAMDRIEDIPADDYSSYEIDGIFMKLLACGYSHHDAFREIMKHGGFSMEKWYFGDDAP